MWQPTVWLDRCDSTQSVLKTSNTPYYTIVATGYQEAGYGRQKSPWLSRPNENLLFSFQHTFEEHERPFLWMRVLCATLTLVKAQGIDVWIKPPNDLYVGRKKLAGILVEAHAVPERHATIGVGLNVLQTAFETTLEATSMQCERPQNYDLKELLSAWQKAYQALSETSLEEQMILYTNHIPLERLDIFENGRLLRSCEWSKNHEMMAEGRRLDLNKLVYKLKS